MGLEQDEIDYLIQKELEKQKKVDLAQSAKKKIGIMYKEICGMEMESELDSYDEIVSTVALIEEFMLPSSQYTADINRLKQSMLKRGIKI